MATKQETIEHIRKRREKQTVTNINAIVEASYRLGNYTNNGGLPQVHYNIYDQEDDAYFWVCKSVRIGKHWGDVKDPQLELRVFSHRDSSKVKLLRLDEPEALDLFIGAGGAVDYEDRSEYSLPGSIRSWSPHLGIIGYEAPDRVMLFQIEAEQSVYNEEGKQRRVAPFLQMVAKTPTLRNDLLARCTIALVRGIYDRIHGREFYNGRNPKTCKLVAGLLSNVTTSHVTRESLHLPFDIPINSFYFGNFSQSPNLEEYLLRLEPELERGYYEEQLLRE